MPTMLQKTGNRNPLLVVSESPDFNLTSHLGQAQVFNHSMGTMRRIFLLLFLALPVFAMAQNPGNSQLNFSQQFRWADGIVRIAEQGQLADTLNLWGDVNNPGRYLVPRGTTVEQLISYGRGPARLLVGDATTDWSKMRLEIRVSSYDNDKGMEVLKEFKYRYHEPIPVGMRLHVLENNEVVTVHLRRKPTLADWVRLIAPAITAVSTSIIIIERLR